MAAPSPVRPALGRLLAVVAITVAGLVAPLVAPAVPAGAGAPTPCETSATHVYICRGYLAYVRRNPSSSEVAYWAGRTPFPRSTFNSALGKSLESRRVTVRAYYDHFADYEPGPAPLAYWQDEILKPNGLRRLEAALLGSYVGMIDGFLDRAFETELGREPSETERDYWGARVVASSRTQVAAELSNTPESRRAKVRFAYRVELAATVDAGGLAYWAERLRTGLSYLELRIHLRTSTTTVTSSCSQPAPRLGLVCL